MTQMLDLVGAIESVEASKDAERVIVWRLVEAHTNSPPFTIVARPFAKDPQVSVDLDVDRVTKRFGMAVTELVAGKKPDWLPDGSARLLKQAFKRNLNGIGATDISIDDVLEVSVKPSQAKAGLAALEHAEIDAQPEDLRRTEYGTVEGLVVVLTTYHQSPALQIVERLTNERVTCVLSEELAAEIGPEHSWSDAWKGRFLRIGGEMVYGKDGKLKRIHASYHEEVVWSDVPVSALKDLDILQGKTIQEHLDDFWGETD